MQLATHPKYRSAIALGLSLGCLSLIPATVSGQSVREREAIRRQGLVLEADNLLIEGRKSFAEGNYQEAVQKYRAALDTLPNGTATADRRREFTAHLSDGSVALSQQYRREGRYDEARTLLGDVLVADPTDNRAQTELDYLDDPIRTNPSLEYEHTKDIDKVRRHLYKGEGFYNLGKFDEAHEEFNSVLRIDPYNTAARRWQERVNAARSDYYRSAYDETRSRLLMEVDKAWAMAVPPEAGDVVGGGGPVNQGSGSFYIQNKLKSIIIPSVDFEGITVEEAIDFLRQRSRELDTTTINPTEKGINFVIRKARIDAGGGGLDVDLDSEGGLTGGDPGEEKIPQLKLNNVPLATVLTYICDQAKLRYKVDEYAVTLLPIGGGEGDDLLNRTWTVPPTFMQDIDSGSGGGGGGDPDPFADTGGGGGGALTARPPLKTLLSNNGITFPGDASASYLPGTSSLVVRNTSANLDLVDALVEKIIGTTPKMINIQSKFVEIAQENTDELGFDWIINPISFGGEALLGGGTIGSGTARVGSDFTNVTGSQGEMINGIPGNGENPVSDIVTAGNRSGQAAINGNSIDSLLNNPNRSAQTANVAPGILSLTGFFGDSEFQMIMRGLAQKKGTDIMTAPSVVTRPGQKATIEIIREFIYPTEYEPPELPNEVNSIGTTAFDPITGLPIAGSGGGTFPVTPATPTAFDMEPTGVTLEVEPNVGQNDYVIELRLAPQIVEFEGFINYGSPISAGDTVITENRIEMPVFATRRVTTGITIYDGHTVAIGGMMREDVQNVEDSVPILGDLPLIGRLFQSKSENHIKSNLIVFVTAQIIDATGQPIRGPQSGGTSMNDPMDMGVLPPKTGF